MKTKLLLIALALCLKSNSNNCTRQGAFSSLASVTEGQLNGKSDHGAFALQSSGFTENKGQVLGMDGVPHPEVKFVLNIEGTQIYLLEKGIAYQFTRVHYPEGYQASIDRKTGGYAHEKMLERAKKIRIETFRTDMTLLGANSNCEISTEGKSSDHTNFYNYNVLDVHSFTKITYHNIYPGIDWVLYAKDGKVKHDFIVKPGADPSVIQMQYTDQEHLGLNKDGSFTLTNRMGSITEKKPLSFQDGNKVDTQFSLTNNILSFIPAHFDRTKTLIIDPALIWATYYGGSASDVGFSCATDGSGKVYLAGLSASSSGIASSGHQNTHGGGTYDAFLVKFNASGVRQWATYYGGTGVEFGQSCAVDVSGNVYLSGKATSTSGISSSGHQNTFGGGSVDAFLVKFNTSGVMQWATYYGGTGDDHGTSCAVDVSGNVYLSGYTTSTAAIASSGHQSTHGGGSEDAFLVKFNASGVRQWATYYGGTLIDNGFSCAADASGNVYLAGVTRSTAGIASSGHQSTHGNGGGGEDGFLVKFNASGVRQWGTYYGGTGDDHGRSCAVDASGDVYLAGHTNSITAIASSGHQNTFGGGPRDAFLVKFNASGVRQWGTYYGDTGYDLGTSCAVDASGNVYLTGFTDSSSGIASSGHQNTIGGYVDAFLVKFNASGVRQWATYYGGTGFESSHSCTSDVLGNVYLAGYTDSSTGIASSGHQNTYGGGSDDAILVKFCEVAPIQPTSISGNTIFCSGSSQTYSINSILAASSYSWNTPGGWSGTSTTNTISVIAGSSGTVSVIAINACGASPAQTLNVTINPLPVISVNSGSICQGASFTINPAGANTYTIQGGNAVVSPNASSNYTVSGTSSQGCVSQSFAIASVTVSPNPTITINSGAICNGQIFTIIPAGASTYSYSSGSSIVSPGTNTTYTVIGTSAQGCSGSAMTTVTVNPLPSININGTLSVICEGESVVLNAFGATSYTWVNGSGGASLTITPTVTSTFSLTGTDANGCVNTASAMQAVDACAGLWQAADPFAESSIYPNPNGGELSVKLSEDAQLLITDALGKIVFTTQLKAGTEQIPVNSLTNGVYFVKLNAVGKQVVKRIVVER